MDNQGSQIQPVSPEPGLAARHAQCHDSVPVRSLSRRKPALLFLLYILYLVLFTLAPFSPVVDDSLTFQQLLTSKFQGPSTVFKVTAWDIWTNIVLFVPYGILVAVLSSRVIVSGVAVMVLVIGSASLLSFGVEVLQLFLPRFPSMADVVWNTAGAAGGAALWLATRGHLTVLSRVGRLLAGPRRESVLLVAYVLLIIGSATIPAPMSLSFMNWNPTFHLHIGNEGTGDRPWRGDVFMLALYDRALKQDEIRQNYSAGPWGQSSTRRVPEGQWILYDFTEGEGPVIHDRVPSSGPVDMRIANSERIEWLTPSGLRVSGDTTISSMEPPPSRLARHLSWYRTLSLEAWVRPANLEQVGPARIFSYSKDPNQRNFTLAQQGEDIVFRLRTPASGSNGTRGALHSESGAMKAGIHHVLVTYEHGEHRLFVDGVERSRAAIQPIPFVDVVIALIGKDLRWPVWFALIAPGLLLGWRITYRYVPGAGSCLVQG